MRDNLRVFPVSDDLERRIRYHQRQIRNERIGYALLVLGGLALLLTIGWRVAGWLS